MEAARKFAQKGAKAKALKEYTKLLQADPRDAKLLLEVGDCYRRWGQATEAIAQYAKVAQQYRQEGFDARAVAVFKQILNLDPKHYSAYVSLSELYQRMGLDAEAIAALQAAADGFHKEGRKPEALDLLRQMAALDPSNTTSRLKVADLLRQEGMESEAITEYEAVAKELESQGTRDQLIAVHERILELQPGHLATLTSLSRQLMLDSRPDDAEPFALRALEASREPAQLELLIELYSQMQSNRQLAEATRDLAGLYRERGDDEKARELMQRLPAEEVATRGGLAADISEVEEPRLGDDEILDEDPFDTFGGQIDASDAGVDDAEALELDDEISLDDMEAMGQPEPDRVEEPSPRPEGDPDQLLAEASVYLRYGKREQAIASLQAILEQDPDHRAALEKLGEAYAIEGREAEAVAIWSRVAEQIRRDGDSAALDVLRERVAALDPEAAERILAIDTGARRSPSIALDVTETEPSDLSLGLDVDLEEIDLDLDQAIEEVAAGDTRSGLESSGAEDLSEDEFEIEIDLDDDPFGEEDAEDRTTEQSVAELDLEDEDEVEVEVEDEKGSGIDATTLDPGDSTDLTDRLTEEIEEAEFYLAQELFDEAESILLRILEAVPDHAEARTRLAEVQAVRGGSSAIGSPQPHTRVDSTRHADGAPADVAETTAPLDLAEPESPVHASQADVEESDTTEESTADGDSFDLREALADVLGEANEPAADDASDASSGVLSTVEDGFESIFSDFKKGVSATLEVGDYDTRYDLGIAYREMGLFEDAIGEFRVCLESDARRFDSLYLMGLCARDLGRHGAAVQHLEQALALPEIPSARLPGVYFDLSLAHEGAGDRTRALSSMEQVVEIEPGFPGAGERLAGLRAGTSSAPASAIGEPGEGFESFDDLFDGEDDEAGDREVVEAVPVETWASFDDVVAEAEADTERDAEDGQADSIEPDDDTQTRRKSGRSKISFV